MPKDRWAQPRVGQCQDGATLTIRCRQIGSEATHRGEHRGEHPMGRCQIVVGQVGQGVIAVAIENMQLDPRQSTNIYVIRSN